MADNKGDDWFKLPTIGVIALVAAVAGHVWKSPVPYIDGRPGSASVSAQERPQNGQDVEARLWQDPFSARRDTPAAAAFNIRLLPDGKTFELRQDEAKAGGGKHDRGTIYADWQKPLTCRLTIVAALVPGGKYAEEVEARQRQRYALLSALAVRGFVPIDPEHLGYFDIETEQLNQRVWFERFESTKEQAAACPDTSAADRVLVLWVNDDRFDCAPIAKIEEVFRQAAPKEPKKIWETAETWAMWGMGEQGEPGELSAKGNVRYAVIGPNQSRHLTALADEAFSGEKRNTERNPTFFPAIATAANDVILRKAGTDCDSMKLSECLHEKTGVRLFRTTPDDEALSRALVAELRLHRVNADDGDLVVLLSEWDSLYGRELPRTFARAYTGNDSDPRIFRFSYVRGIDGRLAGKAEKNETAPERNRDTARKADPDAIERPEGQSQKDYLRRLVETIYEKERQAHKEITAIGVLGYDLYDKLTILQALRARFPGKVFFTTDLDATYLHPNEQPYTHNLIVAAGFDLRLRNELQRDIPPFRDSLQTAVFYSTLRAMQDDGASRADYKLNPLVFEIGRHQHVPLKLTGYPSGSETLNCQPGMLANCGNFHPLPSERWGQRQFLALALALACFIVLTTRMSWAVRDALSRKFVLPLPWPREVSLTPLVAIAVFLFVVLVGACPYFVGRDGEPFYWTNGVSIWPSEMLLLLAFVLAWALLARAWHSIETDRFGVEGDWRRLGYMEIFRLNGIAASPEWGKTPENVNDWTHRPTAADHRAIEVAPFLAQYHALGEWRNRLRRAVINWFWFIAVGLFVTAMWGEPHTPARGDAAFFVDGAMVILAATSVVFLTIWIVDAARLTQRMIRHLATGPSLWPEATLKDFADWLGIRAEDGVAEWIDVRFIAHHTAVIQNLIWYPVAPVLLMVFARNTVFDDWDFPPGLIVMFALLLIYAFSCLFHLQSCAKDARRKAVDHLTRKLDYLRGMEQRDERRIEQVAELRNRVAELKEGAFEPLLEQPTFKALLTLLGGGGLAMTDIVRFLG